MIFPIFGTLVYNRGHYFSEEILNPGFQGMKGLAFGGLCMIVEDNRAHCLAVSCSLKPYLTFLLKEILFTHFFTLYIHRSDAFWPNFMVLSFQLLKLWPFFGERCSQNNDFTVKTQFAILMF